MAGTPNPRSYEQLTGEMLATYMAKIGVNDLNTASAVTSFFEAVGQGLYRAQGDIFQILRDFSVDRASGEALKRLAAEELVKLENARVTTGKVTITDTNFQKILTKVYAGASAPNIGSTVIKVSDASLFAASGQIYIGRGTPNIEGPLSYSAKTQVGGYWELTLTTQTTKFHNISESVILAQGGLRNIPSGTVVKAPAAGGAPDINFKTTTAAIILDGENVITSVPVAADEPGSESNVPRGSIRIFGSPPFTGAIVTNDQPFTTGRNAETDEEIRAKIKRARISRGLGTALAIKNATLGAQATDENARVASNEIFSDEDSATLFIDDGSGYEQKTRGVGLEYIVDSALGGETRFQLATGGTQTSVAKAFLESAVESPFTISPNDRLAILVGGILSEHVFSEGNFRSNGFATAYEVAASINSNPDIAFVARTSSSGKKITIEAKLEANEYLQVTTPTQGSDAGAAMGFTSNEVQTLRLYKNRQPLNRNGRQARVESANQSDWANSIVTGDTLILAVDKTASITFTFTNSDFLTEGTYPSVSKSNSLQSWVNVFNNKVTGITASINGNRIVLTSNRGASSRASLVIDPSSTLVSKGMFTTSLGLESEGAEADFTLSRNTAQFKLLKPLQAGDSLAAGTEFNKASVSSTAILGGNVSFASDAFLWFLIDEVGAEIINTGVVSDTLITVTKPSPNIIRYTSNVASAFANLQVGDYVIIWSAELNQNNRLEARVAAKTNTTFDIRVTATEFAGAVSQTLIQYKEGMVFVRSARPPQKIKFAAGSYNINTAAAYISSVLVGASASTLDDEIISISSKTEDTYGSVFCLTFNDAAKALNFTAGAFGQSIDSHFAFYESSSSDADYPLFIHSRSTNAKFANPSDSFITDFNSALALGSLIDPNELVVFLHPYLNAGVSINDAQADNENVQINSIAGSAVFIDQSPFVKRVRVDDRFWIASSFNFSHNDSLVVVLDEDPTNKTFLVPLYRRALANNTMGVNANDFRAYDVDSGSTAQFATYFTSSYSFKNYKALMKARMVIDPNSNANEDAVLFRSAYWGKAGNKFRVGYGYPTSASQPITHTIVAGDTVDVRINLKSGNAVPNQIDGTTEWDVTVTPNTPVAGVDEVTYTWNAVGSNPNMTTLAPGHYVSINTNGEFSVENTGTFKVDSATSTSFTVRRPNGAAVAENNIATLTSTTISLYQDSDTTAQEVVDYVTASLADFLTASVVADNGTTGAGVIDTSTYEDNNFAANSEFVTLVDGINWIAISNLGATAPNAQFSFKIPLAMPSFNTNTVNAYTFSAGEEVRFIPTTSKQVDDLISTLAVSGITTLSKVDTSSRNGKLQIATNILGSNGAVQVTGGTANENEALVIGQSSTSNLSTLLKTTISRSSAAGFQAGQVVRLEATNAQKKDSGINVATAVTIHPNTIVTGSTVIELLNKEDGEIFFGQPRPSFRDVGRAFHVEKHGKLVCISWDGVGSNPLFSNTVEINADGGNISVDFDGSLGTTAYTVATGTRIFSEVQPGDLVVIQNMAAPTNNGSFKILGISDDKKTIVVNNLKGVDAAAASVASGDLVITSEIHEGDTIQIGAPFTSLNQGKFRVIRRFANSVYIENNSAVEERVIIAENLRSLGFDATTEFDVSVPGNMRITWNGTGTQPNLQNAKLGDYLTVGTAFDVSNRGTFMVTKSNKAMNEQFIFTVPAAADLLGSQRIHFDLPNGGTSYYGWFDLNNTSTDPAPISRTGVQFDYTGSETSLQMAVIVQVALNALTGVTATVNGDVVTVVFDDFGPCVDAENIDVLNGDLTIIQQGSLAFVECANSKAIAETGINVSSVGGNVLKSHIPSMVFSPYENTNAGDYFIISSNVLTANNKGTYLITEVLDQNRIVISPILGVQNDVALVNDFTQVYIEEEKPYVGYKKLDNLYVDPSNFNRYIIAFDTDAQAAKINDVGDVVISGLGKLNFPSINRKGLDSYRYHTGLIAQTNKIVYGDPRDNVTYPGVAAAGAEIFIEPPLFRRITVSINVRIKTGIPFTRVVEQVRNNIAALVNSTAIGQPIAISDIIATVNSIPGVSAVSISSPSYSPTADVIAVAANEKPLVIDTVNDIIVSKVE
jgi:hypothetical protein